MICCLLCHFQPIVYMNSRKRLRKGLVTYYKTSGITCLQKHLDVNHSIIYKRSPKKKNEGKKNVGKQFAKKRSLISNFFIFEFFCFKRPLQKDDVEQKMFVENLAHLIVKTHLPLQFVESVWLKRLVL